MKHAQLSRQNHYVPVWYQKGFILGPRTTLQYLDPAPPETEVPDGRIIIGRDLDLLSPKKCFRKRDLYTTRFGRTLNDEIERFFFGTIDTHGAVAVRAFAGNDLELMLEMQYLRQMHCTMWSEYVREIVSAEKSDVKFIVRDHPVTVYNPACPPMSSACLYPEDPSIGLIGTQTVFALDAHHCLILTNLEYAQDPGGVNLLAPRQNARHAGQTLTRTDAFVRDRMLTRDEVISINAY